MINNDDKNHFMRMLAFKKLMISIQDLPNIELSTSSNEDINSINPNILNAYIELGKDLFDIAKSLSDETADRDYMYNGGKRYSDECYDDKGLVCDKEYDYDSIMSDSSLEDTCDDIDLITIMKNIMAQNELLRVVSEETDTVMLKMSLEQYYTINKLINHNHE